MAYDSRRGTSIASRKGFSAVSSSSRSFATVLERFRSISVLYCLS